MKNMIGGNSTSTNASFTVIDAKSLPDDIAAENVGFDLNIFNYPIADNTFNRADSSMFETREPMGDKSMDVLWSS